MGTSVLLFIREVLYDSIYVVCRRHEQIHGLITWLRVSIARDRLNHYGEDETTHEYEVVQLRTRNIFLENIELLKYRTQKFLRKIIDDKDFPSGAWVDGSDSFQEL
jgi:hypothetical protein